MSLELLKERVEHCTRCEDLVKNRTQTVFADGNPEARIVFVGEAPGADEDKEGIPFVGKAGKMFDNILKACGFVRNLDVYIINVLKCLDGSSRVLTEDGWRRINWIYRHKYRGRVACWDTQGKIVYSPITAHYRSLLGGRSLYRVSLLHSRRCSKGPVGATLTDDHKVLTQYGFCRVGDLKDFHLIHSGTFQPSHQVREAILGTLLGDASMNKKSNCFQCGHSEHQREYLKHKAALLGVNERVLRSYSSNNSVQFHLKTSPYWRRMCRKFYPEHNSKKVVPVDLLSDFSIISLAYLYMDDGGINKKGLCEIATCNFQLSEVDSLILAIGKLGIKAYRRKRSKYPRIHFDKRNSERLCQAIAPYIIPTMAFKIKRYVKSWGYDLVTKGVDEPFFDHFRLLKVEKQPKWTYCIDVDRYHNFVTRTGIVHNCRPPGNRNPKPEEAANCDEYLVAQIEFVKPDFIVCLGAVASQHLLAVMSPISELRGKWHKYRGTPVLCTYHPSYLLRSGNQKHGIEVKRQVWKDMKMLLAELQKQKEKKQ